MCILFYTYFSNAQNVGFEWLNKDLKKFENFDLSSQLFYQKDLASNYSISNKFKLVDFDLRDFPLDKGVKVNGFNVSKDLTYFTFNGTGYVFKFDRLNKILTRIDQTFYRGYNFDAVQFYRNGTLYSLGGAGFWNIHSLLTYYDFQRREWEVVETFGDIKPERVVGLSAGYHKLKDKVYVIESKEEFAITNPGKQRVFSLDLKTMVWEYKGDIDLNKMSQFNLDLLEGTWLGEAFYFHVRPENAIIANPETNELFIYKGKKKLFFGGYQENFQIGDYVYSLRPQFTKAKTTEVLDSLSFDELKKDLKKVDSFYAIDLFSISSKDLLLICLLVISLFLFILALKRRPKRNKNFNVEKRDEVDLVWDLLSNGGHAVLDFVLQNGCNYKFTTDEISKILGCDKKAFDTQRQYRSKFISNFNIFFEEHFNIENAIYRISSEDDKRFVCYQLSEEAVKVYKKFIEQVN